MTEHCAHARLLWNVALEQANCWRRHLGPTPDHHERCRQLTEARASLEWLRVGSYTVQQEALRDFDQAMRNWWNGTHRHPTWRKADTREGFRVVGSQALRVEQLNRRWSRVLIPKVGWVRFRRTRPLGEWKSYRVTHDRSGRWHIAFAIAPPKIQGPGDGSVVGVDRGVKNTLALSTGELLHAPIPDRTRRTRLQRRHARMSRGSRRREAARIAIARQYAKETDRKKDWVEKTSTDLARRFDVIALEDLNVRNMVRSARGTGGRQRRNVRAKSGLNRSILEQGWGLFAQRCADKGTVIKVPAKFTSQMCSSCGEVDANSRESQAKFVCTTCGVIEHADVNAAKNIRAAGRAVAGRGDIPKTASDGGALSMKRQPQLLSQ